MTYRDYGGGFGGMLSPGVKGLLIANAIAYLLQTFYNDIMIGLLGLTPELFWSELAIWQPVTYMFLHGGLMHLAFNMIALWMFGGALESYWGTNFFLRYYFITGIGAGLCNALLTPGSQAVIIGASGAVYGLLAAYGILFPNSLIFIWGLVPLRAKYLVIIFGGIEFVATLRPGTSPVAHLVHLGGMVIGIIYLRWATILYWLKRKSRDWQRDRDYAKRNQQFALEQKLRREVDDLLDKINEVGLNNLTEWEKRRLKEASDQLKDIERRNRSIN